MGTLFPCFAFSTRPALPGQQEILEDGVVGQKSEPESSAAVDKARSRR
jgi:hypothetical protein